MAAWLVGFPHQHVVLPEQEHTSRVAVLRDKEKVGVADAIITRRKDVLIGVRAADCVPILIYDRARRACGAVHAGWRGTAAGIVINTIAAMAREFHSNPDDLIVAFGPSIRWCCYNVGGEVVEQVGHMSGKGNYHRDKDGLRFIDLPAANRAQALRMGVRESNIWMSQECTRCRPDRFYSYRVSGRVLGSQGGFIGMKG